jgi:hypothetical protein
MHKPDARKRSQRRVEAAIPIQVRGVDVHGIEFEDSATALEVSRRGLSFLTQRELAVFATLTLWIPGRGPTRPGEGPDDFFTEAAVVRTLPEGEHLYRVAVRFTGATLPMYSAENF